MKIEMKTDYKELVCAREMKTGRTYRQQRKEAFVLLCCDNGWVNLTTNRIVTRIDNFTSDGWVKEWEEVNAKVVVA